MNEPGEAPEFGVIIPARFASTRLPGKPLVDLGGKPMIVRVMELAAKAGAAFAMVATDDQRIVDVVTAADIGGLPDVSISDALTRLPGISAERINGEASAINIRGMSGGFVETTLNGREQGATSGSRVIQFDQYPSEMIN